MKKGVQYRYRHHNTEKQNTINHGEKNLINIRKVVFNEDFKNNQTDCSFRNDSGDRLYADSVFFAGDRSKKTCPGIDHSKVRNRRHGRGFSRGSTVLL